MADAADDVAVRANRLVPVAVEVLDVRVAKSKMAASFDLAAPDPHPAPDGFSDSPQGFVAVAGEGGLDLHEKVPIAQLHAATF
jgi:hypothetical protein